MRERGERGEEREEERGERLSTRVSCTVIMGDTE